MPIGEDVGPQDCRADMGSTAEGETGRGSGVDREPEEAGMTPLRWQEIKSLIHSTELYAQDYAILLGECVEEIERLLAVERRQDQEIQRLADLNESLESYRSRIERDP